MAGAGWCCSGRRETCNIGTCWRMKITSMQSRISEEIICNKAIRSTVSLAPYYKYHAGCGSPLVCTSLHRFLTCRVPIPATDAVVDVFGVSLCLPRCSQLDLQRVAPLLQRLVLRLVQGYLGVKDGGALISQVAYFNQSRLC